jgi:hypothetical protein
VQFDRAVDMGVYPWFVRDPWLEPLASAARFRDALARAERRHCDAVRAFRDAEGRAVARPRVTRPARYRVEVFFDGSSFGLT